MYANFWGCTYTPALCSRKLLQYDEQQDTSERPSWYDKPDLFFVPSNSSPRNSAAGVFQHVLMALAGDHRVMKMTAIF
jgi:hypothetical protein